MNKDTAEEISNKIEMVKREIDFHGLGFDDKKGKTLGILAEFKDPAELLHAAEDMREAGYKRWDCHSPFPIHGLDDAMGMKPSILGINKPKDWNSQKSI